MRASTRAVCAVVAGLLAVSAADADELKWRQSKFDDGTLMLYTADTDEATDAIGSLTFNCKPGSGTIDVAETNIRDRSVRAAIASLILEDGYPTVQLDPGPETSVLGKIASYDAGGWGYNFSVDPEAASFGTFEKTGFFKFKIGNAAVRVGVKAGLGEIVRFRSACRRAPVQDNSRGAKARQ